MDRVKAWLDRPYDDLMDYKGWILFLGFVAIVSLFWSRVIKETIANFKG